MGTNSIRKHELLADYIERKNYGDTVHYQEIEEVTGEKYKTQRFYGAIAKAKNLLEERGKLIVSIGSGDYRIAYPGDYASAYSREVRLANKRIKHGGKILNGAPVADMTQDEVQTFNRVSDFHARLSASLSGNVVEVKRLTSRHPLEQAVK